MVETNASTKKVSSRDKGVLKPVYWQIYTFPATGKVGVVTSVGERKSLYEAYQYLTYVSFLLTVIPKGDGPDVEFRS